MNKDRAYILHLIEENEKLRKRVTFVEKGNRIMIEVLEEEREIGSRATKARMERLFAEMRRRVEEVE